MPPLVRTPSLICLAVFRDALKRSSLCRKVREGFHEARFDAKLLPFGLGLRVGDDAAAEVESTDPMPSVELQGANRDAPRTAAVGE